MLNEDMIWPFIPVQLLPMIPFPNLKIIEEMEIIITLVIFEFIVLDFAGAHVEED